MRKSNALSAGHERNELHERSPVPVAPVTELLKARIIETLTVEPEHFNREEFDALWVLWHAHEANGGTEPMTTFITRCRTCGVEFEPDHAAIMAGRWRICPACQPAAMSKPPTPCERCGRPLRAATRTLCLSCLGGAPL